MNIDFHSHILPCIDDGAESIEISLAMLRAEQEQGVSRVVLSPHFYRQHETVENFLLRREIVRNELEKATAGMATPELILGAEVAMTKALCYEDLTPLCLSGTKTLLLELPYAPMDRTWLSDVEMLINRNSVQIVLVHIERFRRIWGRKAFDEVMELPVYKQVNCGSILRGDAFQKRRILQWIAEDRVHLLGTDAHNCSLRPVNMSMTLQLLERKGLAEHGKRMMQLAETLTTSRDYR